MQPAHLHQAVCITVTDAVLIYPGLFLTLVGFVWRHVVEYSLTVLEIFMNYEYSYKLTFTKHMHTHTHK